jgi:hypothetical protein
MITSKARHPGHVPEPRPSGARALSSWRVRALWLSWLIMCSHAGCLPPLSKGVIAGAVIGEEPVNGAWIQVWVVDGLGHTLGSAVAEGRSWAKGRFYFEVDLDAHREFVNPPFLLLNASFDPISDPDIPDKSQNVPPFSIWMLIPGDELIGPYADIVITPLTTVAMALGEAWLAQGKAATYTEAMERAHRLLGEHFRIPDITRIPGITSDPVDGDLPPITSPFSSDMYYTLVLKAMSSLADELYWDADEVQSGTKIFTLAEALVDDVRGPDAIFDGIGAGGLPVALPSCAPGCQLGPDTLRTDLVRALALGYLRSPESQVSFGDAEFLLVSIASNTEPELFGDALPAPLDQQAPGILALPSLVFDERQDIIFFEDETMAPWHIHEGEGVDLAAGVGGGSCPAVYKHVNLMDANQIDNPLRWRFAIDDDVVGVDEASMTATVHVMSTGEAFPAAIQRAGASASGSVQYEVLVQRDLIPALVNTEGMFVLTLEASDWLGNTTPVSACWIHHPLAPPVWVSEPRIPEGSDALASVTLGGNGNNLALLLNGAPLDLGKGVMEFDVRNGTDAPAYVTLQYSQPSATYSKSWTRTYAELYQLIDTFCIGNMTCTTDKNLDTRSFQSIRGAIAQLITGIRVWDETYLPAIAVSPCEECDASEYRLEPRLANGSPRKYRIMLVATHLPELAPVEDGEPPMVFVDAPIHPVYQPMIITGHVGQSLSVCSTPRAPRCDEESILQSYRAVTEVSITTGMLESYGQVRAAPGISLHTPRPSANTFGSPLRLAALQWSTLEETLPPLPQL